ncbi:PhzF family phenazine biosynthesis protein [Streptomyces sp. NP160]|uniref:PhzF family phenazine biosynthesis protein n=1 Tax=Streptomyces sp. NP160 TaxID=2586637 RepID=UPI00111B969E|nr:PhzF family phenazine biosynthesis protein [Streptomyces sp. NP160]TNM68926.1 PhzF family phenazine biosynthesis protein [Streptomyces sp. NP160]
MTRRFTQVDVFTRELTRGNAVAVVHDAEGLDDDALRAFARWTQLSETTFLLAPTPEGAAAGADYRVRIFTPGRELPFAGHPTLGSARAWLEAGGVPQRPGAVVQECGAGLVAVRRSADDDGDGLLAFEAPPLVRSGPVDPADLVAAASSVGVRAGDVLDAAWVDNGPGWVALLLADAGAVLAAGTRAGTGPDGGPSDVGLVGLHGEGTGPDGAAVEVRAFVREDGTWWEDPVTGSLNAGVGQWLTSGGASVRLPDRYTASQGTALGRAGRVRITREGGSVWVGGSTVVGVSGSVAL